MSNWSLVIIGWSSVDTAVKDSRERFNALNSALIWTEKDDSASSGDCLTKAAGWIYVPPCGDDDAPGSTCEAIAVGHWNHFSPEELMGELDKFEWNSPNEVCVLWKNEHMDQYEQMVLETWRTSEYACCIGDQARFGCRHNEYKPRF